MLATAALQQARVDGDHRQRLGDVEGDAVLGYAAERHRDDLVEVDLADQRGDGAGLQAGHVEEVADQVVEPVGAVLDALQELGLVLLGPGDVVGAQGGHGGLDAGQRGAQVVADGGEQGGADAVALGELAGLLGLADQPLAVEYDGGLGGEGGEHPAVLGGQHPAGERERHVVADGHVDVGVLGARERRLGARRCRRRSRGRRRSRRSSRATDSMAKVSRTRSSSASRLVSPRSTLPARKERISDSARSRAAWWVRRAARSTTEATETATADEDHDGDDVLRVGDGEACAAAG